MTLENSMLCWNPGGTVTVVPWPDTARLSENYACTGLACWGWFRRATPSTRKLHVFVEAMHLIIRDGCDPLVVNAALLVIDEYRDLCAQDMPGVPLRRMPA